MKHSLIALVCASALSWPLAATGAGGGGGGGGGAGGGDEETTSLRSRDPDYSAAMAAVKTQDWQQVVARMGAYTQRQPGDADGWNELGHAHRQMGNMQPALAAYDKALKINPKHRGVHEYLGEAYLQMGDVPKAEQELKALDKLCFFGCEEYSDLKKSIDSYKKGKQAKAS
ncbi:tetratricopeptide repeat protein [Ramlibacter sp. G-1-2-2]|uniref:Tetratricopeptide repeat protein n=1 Tax=Ramlibacter agri TaxID=2728837 RepID=A0A848HH81_9BURK|nr:tetratricopeptide repeat protein [Ramlibacter agri]NML47028.1 tetratricopeptide repeat protein [Ramlibacter agri]